MSVLLDVLNIAKDKRYMVLDQISQPAPDPKTAVQLASKKRVSIFITPRDNIVECGIKHHYPNPTRQLLWSELVSDLPISTVDISIYFVILAVLVLTKKSRMFFRMFSKNWPNIVWTI